MTVAQLIAQLRKLPQDLPVLTNHDDSCGPDYEVNGAFHTILKKEEYKCDYEEHKALGLPLNYVYISAG